MHVLHGEKKQISDNDKKDNFYFIFLTRVRLDP